MDPTITMTLEERDKLKDKAGSLYETVKSYWPLVVMLAGLAGFTGAQVPSAVKAPPAAVASEDKKPAPADHAKRIEDLEKQVNLLLKRELDRSGKPAQKAQVVQPPVEVTGVELLRREFPQLTDHERHMIAMDRAAAKYK